ncbi:NhaP-type Na+/H+ or K+/H+ antiporter [Paraburkholderia sp. GAS448]|uniref:cation:proton antiporter n=1 Tax=Paraburkholderia sp. GAS448 TaxID=3035136 RepID=UPI003D1F4E84
MHETQWFLIVGGIFVAMGIASSMVERLPCSTAMFYLAAGFALGPAGVGLLALSLPHDAGMLRLLTQVALLVSLFATGLRLRVPVLDPLWGLPLRLGFLAMIVTVPLLTLAGVGILQLGWGPSLLLAALLAPTDPVLAHDVQVRHSSDLDRVRFALSGEGGLNDGVALPFVLAGLALCPSARADAQHVFSADFLGMTAWGIAGAIAVGALLSWTTTHAVAWLRTRRVQTIGLEGFFALGLIELSYGAAQLLHTFGFLAVFAAGVAMRRAEHRASGARSPLAAIGTVDPGDIEATAAHPKKAHAYMAESVLGFTIELERIAGMATMMIIGNVLSTLPLPLFTWSSAAFIVALFVLVRPLAVEASLIGSQASQAQRRLMSWFGIRGIGSFYYLAYALESGPRADVLPLVPFALAVVTASVVMHGISATPLMNWYQRLRGVAR